jgi:hypothetical protein
MLTSRQFRELVHHRSCEALPEPGHEGKQAANREAAGHDLPTGRYDIERFGY